MGLLSKGCAFSGHRNVKAEHLSALPSLLLKAIEYAYNEGCRDFYSGGAIGFDIIAAREVLRFRLSHPDVHLVMLLPCVDQDAYWTERQKDNYRFVLSEANEVVYISDEYTPTCIKERNLRLAESADIMICYLYHRASGAGQTVAMATRLGKEVYNLYARLDSESKK